jgi:hypothetical protein
LVERHNPCALPMKPRINPSRIAHDANSYRFA